MKTPNSVSSEPGAGHHVIYLSEATVKKIWVEQNNAIMKRLTDAGLPPHKFIYVQVDEAGSSSPVMLNILRDAAGLAPRGCRFLDANDTLGFHRLTSQLAEGALIYVDDFVGTATQFCTARDFAFNYVEGNFAEYLLAPCICEEGFYPLGAKRDRSVCGGMYTQKPSGRSIATPQYSITQQSDG